MGRRARKAPDGRGWGLSVAARFLVTVGMLVLAVAAVAGVGVAGVQRIHTSSATLAHERLRTVQDSANLVSASFVIHETALLQIAADSPESDQEIKGELDHELIPAFDDAVDALRRDYAGQPDQIARVDAVRDGLQVYQRLREERLTGTRRRFTAAERTELAERIDGIMEPLVRRGEALRREETARAEDTGRDADHTFHSTLWELGGGLGGALLLGGIGIWLLVGGLLPRIRAYSQFARDVAAGRPAQKLNPRGHDELTALGVALDAMVDQAGRRSRIEDAQSEFIDYLQVAASEDEAQELVQRHLERSLTDARVVVLRRNNSANRLEAATDVPDDELRERVAGAEPRSCAALRLGKTHRERPGTPNLVSCTICASRTSMCEPLLVGGEVIGSVLALQGGTPDSGDEAVLRRAVSQSAPTLANLRNLALAEFRANNDALTGLPNKRATDDTLKRMVAQANRSATELTAIMLDLDHFKQVNDRYGHGKGDEVLASVGATIAACLRESDFAGRFGGEEFLVLLPDTAAADATNVAERLRAAIAQITVNGVERDITASLGVADLLAHAGSVEGLIHEADRALYAAKAGGRNRVVIASAVEEAEPAGSPFHVVR